jgi:serine/threonine protein phosphatase PrpC
MEDAYQCIQDLKLSADIKMSYFGVFDGHGGDCCAFFLKENLHKELTSSLAKLHSREPRTFFDFAQSKLAVSHDFFHTFEESVRKAYNRTDLMF